jgi:hypothetical protein
MGQRAVQQNSFVVTVTAWPLIEGGIKGEILHQTEAYYRDIFHPAYLLISGLELEDWHTDALQLVFTDLERVLSSQFDTEVHTDVAVDFRQLNWRIERAPGREDWGYETAWDPEQKTMMLWMVGTDPETAHSLYHFDQEGRTVLLENIMGQRKLSSIRFEYNPDGSLRYREREENGQSRRKSFFTYDDEGKLLEVRMVTPHREQVNRYEYGPSGRLVGEWANEKHIKSYRWEDDTIRLIIQPGGEFQQTYTLRRPTQSLLLLQAQAQGFQETRSLELRFSHQNGVLQRIWGHQSQTTSTRIQSTAYDLAFDSQGFPRKNQVLYQDNVNGRTVRERPLVAEYQYRFDAPSPQALVSVQSSW